MPKRTNDDRQRAYAWIREALDLRRMSQKQLAMAIGLPESRLTDIIKGRRNLVWEEAVAISKVLGVPLEQQSVSASQSAPQRVLIMGRIGTSWEPRGSIHTQTLSAIIDDRFPISDHVAYILEVDVTEKLLCSGDALICVKIETLTGIPVGGMVVTQIALGEFCSFALATLQTDKVLNILAGPISTPELWPGTPIARVLASQRTLT